MGNTVIAYLRTSTDDQALSLESQRADIEAWAAREGVSVASWCADQGVSGGAPLDKRPGLLRALSEAGRRGTIVVARRDRFARDPLVALLAERQVGRVVSVDSPTPEGPVGELVRGVLDSVAAFERAMIRSRTKAALAAKRARGEKTGGALPFGSVLASDGRTLAAHADEQQVIARVRMLAAQGHSQRSIAETLTREGAPCRGARWHRNTVARLLARSA